MFVLTPTSATHPLPLKSGWWTLMVAVQGSMADGRRRTMRALANSNVILGYWVVPCLSLSNLKRSFLGYHFS